MACARAQQGAARLGSVEGGLESEDGGKRWIPARGTHHPGRVPTETTRRDFSDGHDDPWQRHEPRTLPFSHSGWRNDRHRGRMRCARGRAAAGRERKRGQGRSRAKQARHVGRGKGLGERAEHQEDQPTGIGSGCHFRRHPKARPMPQLAASLPPSVVGEKIRSRLGLATAPSGRLSSSARDGRATGLSDRARRPTLVLLARLPVSAGRSCLVPLQRGTLSCHASRLSATRVRDRASGSATARYPSPTWESPAPSRPSPGRKSWTAVSARRTSPLAR